MRSTESVNNPFEGQRWEQDSVNIIYLPEIFQELEKRQDLYLVGSRGTGKTTFLKALNWEIRLSNPSIHIQVGAENIFNERYIGIYINAMSFGDSIFERSNTDDSSITSLYSLWVEINVLYRALGSIIGLFNEGYIEFSIEDEQFHCNRIYDYLQDLLGDKILSEREIDQTQYNIIALKEIIGKLRGKVIDERNDLKQRCESYRVGTLIQASIPYLMDLCDKFDNMGRNKWCTKICFDQIESAPNFQKIANTLVVKKLNQRIWFIISGLNHRDIDINSTYIPGHNLTDDDRKFIDLNDVFFSTAPSETGDFYDLAQGICDLRLKHFDQTIDKNTSFNLKTHFGFWNTNEVLDVFLKQKEGISVSKDFRNFMLLVRENDKTKKYRTKNPPYIETYYYDILQLGQKWEGCMEKSREKNVDTGKKYVGIMLNLLRRYKFKSTTPYVGVHQIMSLCNSTREFLKIMESLFNLRMNKKRTSDLNYFFSYEASATPNEIEIQTQSVMNVAEEKYNNVEQKYANENVTKRMRTFIDTCGQITYDLQSKIELSSLTSEERCRFSVSLQNDENGKKASEFLKNATIDTHIQIISENLMGGSQTIDFELSRIFAPKYKFSFRRTRNKIMMDGKSLIDFCIARPEDLELKSKKLLETVEKNYRLKDYRSKPDSQQTLL